jgi:hypothetical protein
MDAREGNDSSNTRRCVGDTDGVSTGDNVPIRNGMSNVRGVSDERRNRKARSRSKTLPVPVVLSAYAVASTQPCSVL